MLCIIKGVFQCSGANGARSRVYGSVGACRLEIDARKMRVCASVRVYVFIMLSVCLNVSNHYSKSRH